MAVLGAVDFSVPVVKLYLSASHPPFNIQICLAVIVLIMASPAALGQALPLEGDRGKLQIWRKKG